MALISVVSEVRWDWKEDGMPPAGSWGSAPFIRKYGGSSSLDYLRREAIITRATFNNQERSFLIASSDFETITTNETVPFDWYAFDWINRRVFFLSHNTNTGYMDIKFFYLDRLDDPWEIPIIYYRYALPFYGGGATYDFTFTPNFIFFTIYPYNSATAIPYLFPLTNKPRSDYGFYRIVDVLHFHPDLYLDWWGTYYTVLGYNHFEEVLYFQLSQGSTSQGNYVSYIAKLPIDHILYGADVNGTIEVRADSFEIVGPAPPAPANSVWRVSSFANIDEPGVSTWYQTDTPTGRDGLALFKLSTSGAAWEDTGVSCPFPVRTVRLHFHNFGHDYFWLDVIYSSSGSTSSEGWRVHLDSGEWNSFCVAPIDPSQITGSIYMNPPGQKELWCLGGVRTHQEEVNRWDIEEQSWNYPIGYWEFLNITYPHPSTEPLGRDFAALAYNQLSQRYYMMGGRRVKGWDWNQEIEVLNDLWEFDPTLYTWAAVTTTGTQPEPRAGHSFVHNKMDGCFYLYGGIASLDLIGTYAPFEDLWKLNSNNEWSEVNQTGALKPSGRYQHGCILRTVDNSMYILGGRITYSPGLLFDFWRFDIHSERWFLITEDIRLDISETFEAPIRCVYDEARDAMYVMSSGGSISFLSYYFGTQSWDRSTYNLLGGNWNYGGFLYDNIEDELYIFSTSSGSRRATVQLVRTTLIDTEPQPPPIPEFSLPVKKICEGERTKMMPMDDCAWWWESSDKNMFLDLEERACKVGSVRVRHSKYKRVKDHPLAFFSQVLEGGPDLYLDHEGISCRFHVPDDFLVDSDYPEGDFDNIVIIPDSDMYEPLLLDSTRNNEVILDQSGYQSGDYNVYMTSFDPLWEELKEGYMGTAVLSKEETNTGSYLRGRIDGTVVYAKKIGKVKLKITLNKDKFISDPYIGEALELIPGTGQMKKISLSGSDTASYVGLMNCCFYWQSHYVSGGPIYLAVEYVVDDEVLGYDFSVVLRSCILPKNIDLDGMVRSGRIEAPPLPERYFYTTFGSSEAPMSYGTQLSSEAKWYQISSDNGMIGGVMPSVGDAVLVEILMQPPSLVQKEFSSIYKAPLGITSASVRVKHTSDVGYVKTQRSNFDQVPRIPEDFVIPTVTSEPDSTDATGIHFFLNLTDALDEAVTTFYDLAQSRICSVSGSTKLAALQNPGGSNLSLRLGTGSSSDWSGNLIVSEVETGNEYLYPEEQFILSSYLYLDMDNAQSTGYEITCNVDLLKVGIERETSNFEDFPVDFCMFQPSWGPWVGIAGAPTEGHYFFCSLSVLRTRYFMLYWGCDHLYFMPDSQGFRLDPLALPFKEWFKLSFTRNGKTNEYAWFLNDEIIKDEFGQECRWKSKTYWYSTPLIENYRGPASAQSPFNPRLLNAQGVKDAYVYACYYQLDKYNTLI